MDVDFDTKYYCYVISTDFDGNSMKRKRVDECKRAGNKLVAVVFFHALLG
jgi:hypothetical protein